MSNNRELAKALLTAVLDDGREEYTETFHASDHAYIGENEYYIVKVERRQLYPLQDPDEIVRVLVTAEEYNKMIIGA